MPPLEKPREARSVALPRRRALHAGRADVLVVGGGPAGLGAALGAAGAGASVVLAEQHGFLGGNATAALVMPMMSGHTWTQPATAPTTTTLLPADTGPGRPVVGGAWGRLLEELVRAGGAIPPSLATGYVVPFDPEVFKSVAFELLDEAGVGYLLHAFAIDAYHEASGWQVVFASKSGLVVVEADVVVDCTGDGDVAAVAGARFEIGRERDGLVQPMTLMFRMVEFERQAFRNYAREHPGQWRGVYGLWSLIREAAHAGELDLPREDILFFAGVREHEIAVNSTRVVKVLGTDVWDLTYAEWLGRRQMRQLVAFFRRYVPGFEDAWAVQSGHTIGVRETRRIVGQYRLTGRDILHGHKFADRIACGAYPVDIHNPAGKGTVLKRLKSDDYYTIPLRALIPAGIDGVLVAGRCISGTAEAFASYRVTPTAMATGQAAGVCAARAARTGQLTREIPPGQVQEELLRQGAILEA